MSTVREAAHDDPSAVADPAAVAGLSAAPRRRLPEWVVAVAVGLLVVVAGTIPFLLQHGMYYAGDNAESFVPMWHHLGLQLRAGHWPTMDPSGWYGGNYAAEAGYALWNPVQLLDYVVVSYYSDLASAAAFVQIQFLALLGIATYLLCREYGAARPASVVVAAGLPVAGYTLYYDAAGWPSGLMAFTWAAWFWWAARRQSRGRSWPLLPFLIGALGVTTGSPYALLGIVIVLAGIGIELLVRRDFRRFAGLVLTGLCVGATAVLVFLPLMGTLSVTNRLTLAMLSNDGFLVPHLSDVAASSSPTYLPPILNWGGALFERLPSTYFLWFAIPLLPWLRWSRLRRTGGRLTSLWVLTAVFGALTFGPSNVWLFRWPIRLIEYFYLCLAILLAIALSSGLARDHVRRRSLITAALVVGGGYLSWAVRPDIYRMHVVAGVGVLVLVLAATWMFRRWGMLAAGAVLVVGTLLVVTYQTSHLPLPSGGNGDVPGTPFDVAQVEQASSAYEGTVLQLADQATLGKGTSRQTSELLFGNESLMSGHESVVRYSGIGFQKFSNALCMDYKGQVCPGAYDAVWHPIAGTGVPLIDLMKIRTLVIDNPLLPGPAQNPPPAGWRVAAQDSLRTVWVRTAASPYPGRLSWASPGVDIHSDQGTGSSESVSLNSTDAGTLVFARLAWPGYTATLDGKPVLVQNGPAGLVMVGVPAGSHRLELRFESPGVALGFRVLAVALLISLAQTVAMVIGRRRKRRSSGTGRSDRKPTPGSPSEDGQPQPDAIPAAAAGA